MSVISGYDKYKRYQKVSDDSYKLVSHWTSSNTVHFDDGSTAEEKVEEINTSINETKNEINTSINEVDTRITNTIDKLSSNVAYIENGNEEVANIDTVLTTKSIVDNVNSSSKEMALSAKQGKFLNERISYIITHNNETDGNTELLDIRVDTDGTTHTSAGDAIRSQVNKLSSEIDFHLEGSIWGDYKWEKVTISTENGVDVTKSNFAYSTPNFVKLSNSVVVNIDTTIYSLRVYFYNDDGTFDFYVERSDCGIILPINKNMKLTLRRLDSSHVSNIREITSYIHARNAKNNINYFVDRGYMAIDSISGNSNYIHTARLSRFYADNDIVVKMNDTSIYRYFITTFDELGNCISVDGSRTTNSFVEKGTYFGLNISRQDLEPIKNWEVETALNSVYLDDADTKDYLLERITNNTIDVSTGELNSGTYAYRMCTPNITPITENLCISANELYCFRVHLYDENGVQIAYKDKQTVFALLKGDNVRIVYYANDNSTITEEIVDNNYNVTPLKTLDRPCDIFRKYAKLGTHFNIKLIGDSITHGVGGTGFEQNGESINETYSRNPNGYCWANLLKALLESKYDCNVVNNGCRGTGSNYLLSNWNTLISENDNLIICMYGTNDRAFTPNPEDFKRNISNIRARALAENKDIIFMSSIPAGLNNELCLTGNYENIYYHMEDVDNIINIATDGNYIPLFQKTQEWLSYTDVDLLKYLDSYQLHPNDDLYYKMFAWICNGLGIGNKIKDATW